MTKKRTQIYNKKSYHDIFLPKDDYISYFCKLFKSFCELLFPFCNEKSQLKINMLPVGVTLFFIFFVFFVKKWSRFAPLNPSEMFNFPKFSPYYKCKKMRNLVDFAKF